MKLSTTQKKQTTQNTAQQNYPGSVAFYHTRPGNEVGLFYSSRAPTGHMTYNLMSVIFTAPHRHSITTRVGLSVDILIDEILKWLCLC